MPARDKQQIIIHVDMDAFYAAIEQRDHPEWRGKPVVVGAPPDQRGVVSTASYEARPYGIHSAMPSCEAGKRCPHAVFVYPRMDYYKTVSATIFSIFESYTPLVEGVSIDEAYLDVTGAQRLYGDGREIARRIKQDILEQTSLTCSAGVASNKFLAKLGSEFQKPNGLTVLPFERKDIIAFLRPLPVTKLWGVGKITQQALDRAALYTMADVQDAPLSLLQSVVGPHNAKHLQQLAFGEDARQLEVDALEKSISREHTFLKDERSRAKIENILFSLVEDVAARLRRDGRHAGTGRLKIRWKGFETITRQAPFDHPTIVEDDLHRMASALFEKIDLNQPVRLIGFGVTNLMDRPPRQQLSLFDEPTGDNKKEALDKTIDTIRRTHGPTAIRRARQLPPKKKGKD